MASNSGFVTAPGTATIEISSIGASDTWTKDVAERAITLTRQGLSSGRELEASGAGKTSMDGLRAKAAERRTAWLQSLVGTEQRVLVELGGKGHTDAFAPVRVTGADKGEVVDIRITALEGDHLFGVPA